MPSYRFKSPVASRKVALDALLEMYNDEDYATHQHHSDPDFTTQNGKMMGKGTEVEQGALDSIPGSLLASKKIAFNWPKGYRVTTPDIDNTYKWFWTPADGAVLFENRAVNDHAKIIEANGQNYDYTPKGIVWVEDENNKRMCVYMYPSPPMNVQAIDDAVEEFKHMLHLGDDWEVEVRNRDYNGIYSQPKDWMQYKQLVTASAKRASAALPAGYEPDATLTDDTFKWIWSPQTGPVIFKDKTNKRPEYFNLRITCVHADVIYLNRLKYDTTPMGYIDVRKDFKTFRVRAIRGFSNSAELTDALDAVADEFIDMYGLTDFAVEIPSHYGYKGIYQQPKVEDEDGDEGLTQLASDAKMTDKIAQDVFMNDPAVKKLAAEDGVSVGELWTRYASEFTPVASTHCAACECGDCDVHTAGTIHDLTTQVVPVADEPSVEDATFFKESEDEDEFEVTRTATGDVVVAATKSYGAGTPIGGTPNVTPQPSTSQPPAPVQEVQPTPLTTAPPQQVQNTQPQQPTPVAPSPDAPPPSMQQQLQEQLLGQTTTASRIKLRLACGVEKEFAPAVGTVVKACTDALETSGYIVSTASQKLSSAGHGDSLVVGVERKKKGALIDPKDVIARVNAAINPDYFVKNFKTALVNIKESPTSLPPRDDMRSHLDETERQEAMDGVLPTQPAERPIQPVPGEARPVQPAAQPMTNQQKLQQQALASEKTAWVDDDEDDDDKDNGQYGSLYGKPLGTSEAAETPQDRLEYLRSQLRAECISQGELMELESLVKYIEPDDVELLEAAGVPEEEAMAMQERMRTPATKPKKRFRTTDKDKSWLREMGIKASKIAIQVEEGVNQVCPNCNGRDVKNVEDLPAEDGIVECVDCGCFFSL